MLTKVLGMVSLELAEGVEFGGLMTILIPISQISEAVSAHAHLDL